MKYQYKCRHCGYEWDSTGATPTRCRECLELLAKPGRPPIGQTRTRVVTIKVTEAELAQIRALQGFTQAQALIVGVKELMGR